MSSHNGLQQREILTTIARFTPMDPSTYQLPDPSWEWVSSMHSINACKKAGS